jgi:hypothetical protein
LSNPKSALCFLRCSGCNLIDLRSKGRRKVFVFRAHRSTIGLTIRDPLLAASGSLPGTLRRHFTTGQLSSVGVDRKFGVASERII